MSSDVKVILHCSSCLAAMCEVSDEEAISVMSLEPHGAKCFDCEPLAASHRSEFFKGFEEGDCFQIDDRAFTVESDKLVLLPDALSHAHEYTRVRGLSSYTYLNKTPEKSGILQELVEYELCPECHGQSFFVGAYGGESCGFCGDFGSIPVLAVWVRFLISGGVSNV